MKQFSKLSEWLLRALTGLLCLMAAVPGLIMTGPALAAHPAGDGSQSLPPGGQGTDIHDRSLSRYFKRGLFNSVLVGSYLDEASARRAAEHFRSRGLASFVLKKQVEERLKKDIVSEFYVVLVGLFGRNKDADILGQRLKAESQIQAYRVLPVDDLGEQQATEAQNAGLYARLAEVGRKVEQKAAQPLSSKSLAATGEAFKRHVYGSYVGSYRDPGEAKRHAEKLTAGGWPASVQREGAGSSAWFRVYLAPAEDQMDWKADSQVLKEAQRSAASQPGIFLLVDMSNIQGDINNPRPDQNRGNASACAGFSEAGRLGGSLRRTLIYIPDTSYTAALIAMGEQAEKGRKKIRDRVKDWWDEKPKPARAPLYGPAIFNRPEMEKAISKLKPEVKPISLALGLTELAGHLFTVPGRKIVIVFSEFQGDDKPEEVKEALSRLKIEFGSSLEVVFVYGDTDAKGYALAADLARQAGSTRAWDGCMLMNDNAYFERYIRTIFR